MTRIALLLLIVLCGLVPAQTGAAELPDPIVEVDFPQTETIPGQFLTMRITVLVPSWMPQPVVFPQLDAPNLRVRLPDRATSPTSKRIDGEDWSGVSRRYLISPMAPGTFTLPAGQIEITYADPGNTAQPVTTSVSFDPVEIQGLVPEGAETLDPFIAAKDVKLVEDIPEKTLDLAPGDSVRRSVTATITGASPMMLPQLMVPPVIEGFAAYADEPVLEEKEERGVLSGSRREVVTLMAQGSGSGELPPVELAWYNIDTKKIETAKLEPVRVSVTGANASDTTRSLSVRSLAFFVGGLTILALLLALAWPRFATALKERRRRYLAGRAHARNVLMTAIRNEDFPATVDALQIWRARRPEITPEEYQKILTALRPLSARRYGRSTRPVSKDCWRNVADAVRRVEARRQQTGKTSPLPVLNP